MCACTFCIALFDMPVTPCGVDCIVCYQYFPYESFILILHILFFHDTQST